MSTLENGQNDESTVNENAEQMEKQRRQLLMGRARMMGLSFSNNIATEKLSKMIEAAMEGKSLEPEKKAEAPELNPLDGDAAGKKPAKAKSLRQQLYDKQMRLVRLRITCMDPKKKDLPGEIFTIANEHLGTVRKFVPFGEVTDEGYHVPYCIYKMLEARQFLNVRTIKDRRTKTTRVETTWVREFALEVMPPLTPAQIQDLKTAQLAAGM
ncbi:hypothetical protein Fifi067_00016 [Erwinia phage Fifi067]|nr:hypothetical protein Fifi067_00016 [Erwinia phage Fifi067]WBQ32531.1 hypothetical protein [Erwinia phage Kuerle]